MITLFLCLCLTLLSQGRQSKTDVVSTQETGKVWKNSVEKIQIDDFLSFIFHRDTSSEMTVFRIFINGGKKAEPEHRKGLAFLTTRLSSEIPVQTNVRKLMTLGSSFSTAVEGDFSIITVTCLSEHLEDTLKILAEVLRKPLFSALRIDHIKRFMKYQQKNEEDNPLQLIEREYFNAFFGNAGYGGSIFGTAEPDSLKKIKKKDIVHFYKTFFNRANMVIVVSSDLSSSDAAVTIKKLFHPLAAGEKRVQLPPLEIPGAKKKEYFFKKEKKQALISLGTLLPGMSPQNFTRAYMLENLLGDGIGSKLWPLRAEKNLAYSLNARVTHMKDAGMLKVYLRTDNSKKEKASEALKEVMTDLYQNGVTGEEFQTVKVRAGAQFLRSNETKERRTFYLGLFECIGPGFDFLEDFFSTIEKMTLEEFNGYIKEVLKPDRLVTVIIGPGHSP